jgi:hypothetical protein
MSLSILDSPLFPLFWFLLIFSGFLSYFVSSQSQQTPLHPPTSLSIGLCLSSSPRSNPPLFDLVVLVVLVFVVLVIVSDSLIMTMIQSLAFATTVILNQSIFFDTFQVLPPSSGPKSAPVVPQAALLPPAAKPVPVCVVALRMCFFECMESRGEEAHIMYFHVRVSL